MWHSFPALRLLTCLVTLWAWPAASTYSNDYYKARPVLRPCPNCTTPTTHRSLLDIQEQIQLEAQLELIKQKIIKGLGLKDIPGITSPRTPTPPPQIDLTQNPNPDEKSELNDIIATSEPPDGVKDKNVLQFEVGSTDDANVDVRRGFLYVFLKKKRKAKRKKKIIIRVSTVDTRGKPGKLLSSVRTRLKESRWLKIGMPSDLMKQLLETKSPLKLHLRCKKCKGFAKPIMVMKSRKRGPSPRKGSVRKSRRKTKLNKNRPRLLIRVQTKTPKTRSKRHIETCYSRKVQLNNDTVPTANRNICCKLSYYLNFTEIGWGDWIISPEGTLVSVCDGGCLDRRDSLRGTLVNGQSSTRGRRRDRHCQTTRSSDLTITYFDQSLHIVQKRMRDMTVNTCGCRAVN